MPVIEDDDLCQCGHTLLSHMRLGSTVHDSVNVDWSCKECECRDYAEGPPLQGPVHAVTVTDADETDGVY